MATTTDLRLCDADRDEAVSALGQHHAVGRLSLDEFDERVDAAYRAVTQSDLERLFADLPARTAADPTPIQNAQTTPVWGCGASSHRWRAWSLTAVVCLLVWAATSLGSGHMLYFWPIWVIGPWGMTMVLARLSTPHRSDDRA